MVNRNHKLAAIVFTDIVGYTRQMEKDEHATMQLLEKQREIIFPIVKEYNGEVVKEIGDGLLMMFSSAVDAVRFAIEVQTRLKNESLTIRAGIHIGDVIFKDNDVFGSAVNTAARIEPLARPNGICISEDVRNQIRNKEDINTISKGRKVLKGVNDPLEVYDIIIDGESEFADFQGASFFKDLWDRRVFLVVAIYIAGSWIVKQAVATIVAKYLLSPHIIGLTWIVLISLLPSVLLVSYFHGRRKMNKWTKAELIGLPVNFVLSIMLLVIMFQGKDLGAAAESHVFEDENGKAIDRIVVKSEFRKKIALYNLENIGPDTSINYLQYTIPTLLEYDLSQDVFIESKSAVHFFDKLIDAGYPSGVGLPISVMKKFTNYYHLNYFISGTIDFQDGQFIVRTKLYDAAYGKLIKEMTFQNVDIFLLVDDISVSIKEEVGMPKSHIEQSMDLPIADIFTGSIKALEYYSLANKELLFKNYDAATEYFELALKEDDGFAIGYLSLAYLCFNSNQIEKASAALGKAMDNIDKVPERTKFSIKFFYYLMKQKPEKAMAVVTLWTELYPDDLDAHFMLAQRYRMADKIPDAIKEIKIILKLDPEQYEYLNSLGELYEITGKSDSALYYYQLYAQQFPKNYISYQNIGDHYMATADFDRAKENYERAILLESDIISLSISLINIELRKGYFEKAITDYNDLLANARTATDSSEVLAAISKYYTITGQSGQALRIHKQMIEIYTRTLPVLRILVQKVFMIQKYIKAGEQEEAFNLLAAIESEFEPPLDKLASFGYMFAYIEIEDPDNAEKYIPAATELAKIFGEEVLLANISYGWARIYQMRGDYNKALEYYQEYFESQPTNFHMNKFTSTCYRKLKQFDKAEENISIALKYYPYRPVILYEAALLYDEIGEQDKALEYLRLANDIWKDADSDHKTSSEARLKLEEMTGGV